MMDDHFRLIDSMLSELLISLTPVFSPAEQAEVQQFADASEYGLALETLCGILTEEHKVVDARVKEQVRKLQALMGLDSPMVDALLGTPTSDVG
jgi:hypothetical protein